ncbi:hypothetical protein ABIC09_002317 [Bradyrhizobium sp. S3.12.5]|uniref:hypothetical protein n=1 Tax=Bradyrhizobium sp. S3.12.5 TaxID=3156386 RepID=UPI0033984788
MAKAKSLKDQNRWQLWLAIVVVTVVNGLLSSDAKARIVFLRWRHALPGHRAFSDLAPNDPLIDMDRLKKACGNKLPDSPDEQNKVWYGLYKPLEKQPSIEHVQRDFLLMRDYACFVVLATIGFGIAAFVELSSAEAALLYAIAMIAQFFAVRQAAANYGHRFVTTVMAESTPTPPPRAKVAAG